MPLSRALHNPVKSALSVISHLSLTPGPGGWVPGPHFLKTNAQVQQQVNRLGPVAVCVSVRMYVHTPGTCGKRGLLSFRSPIGRNRLSCLILGSWGGLFQPRELTSTSAFISWNALRWNLVLHCTNHLPRSPPRRSVPQTSRHPQTETRGVD